MGITGALLWVLAALAVLLAQMIRRRLNYWKERGIAHDKPHLLFGSYKGVMKTRTFGEIISGIYERHRGSGPYCGMHLLQKPVVMALEPSLIKNVLIKDFSNFTDRGMFSNERDDPLTGHLFLLDGQKWRVMRNKLSPTFTSGKMKYMFPTIVQVAEQFVDTLRVEVLKSGGIVEIKDLLARFTTDVIGTCAFGIDCNSLKDPNAEFRRMGRRIFTQFRHSEFTMGLIQAFPAWARALRVRVLPDDVHDFFMRIVHESVEYRAQYNVQRKDFLNLLIELNKHKELSREKDSESSGLTVEQMAAQVFVFYVAGFETSSSTMSFCLLELAQQPQIQERLRAEIVEMLQQHNDVYSYECMEQMQYMKQVIAETLRKYPTLPFLHRKAIADYPIPGYVNYIIPKGMSVYIPVIGLQHDPQYYPAPEKFDPERFSAEQVQARDPALWLPFGDGPRNCIGMRFGQMQMRVGLAYLLKNFRVSVCERTQLPLQMDPKSFVMNSKGGIYLRMEAI